MAVIFDSDTRSFHCQGCNQDFPISRQTYANPEAFVRFGEAVKTLHNQCSDFETSERAKVNLHWRNEMQRIVKVGAGA